jgi:hypothetical protein
LHFHLHGWCGFDCFLGWPYPVLPLQSTQPCFFPGWDLCSDIRTDSRLHKGDGGLT